VRDDLREYVVEHLGDEQSSVLIVDESGFLKKGEKSVGVARRYTGTAGKKENCQVGVFLCYASKEGAAFIDRALYLPREWTDDPRRLSEAGVPEGARFATKGELAEAMLHGAFEADVPARWIVADTVYGMTRGLRGWLEKRERSYVLAVTSSKGIYHEGRQRQVRQVARSLPEGSWRSGPQPVRGARAIGPTIGPVCPYPRAKHTAQDRQRDAGCRCVGASWSPRRSLTTFATGRHRRASTS
jgi:SRSO17 transposase